MEQLVSTLGKLPRDTAKKLTARIIKSDGEGIVQIAFIVLDGGFSPTWRSVEAILEAWSYPRRKMQLWLRQIMVGGNASVVGMTDNDAREC